MTTQRADDSRICVCECNYPDQEGEKSKMQRLLLTGLQDHDGERTPKKGDE